MFIKERKAYLDALKQAVGFEDSKQIAEKYEAVFHAQLEKGRTEEEICWSLGPPGELAAAFTKDKEDKRIREKVFFVLRLAAMAAFFLFSMNRVLFEHGDDYKWLFGLISIWDLRIPLYLLANIGLLWLLWRRIFAQPGQKPLTKEIIGHLVCLGILVVTTGFYFIGMGFDYSGGEAPLFFEINQIGTFLNLLFTTGFLFSFLFCLWFLRAAIREDFRYFRVVCHSISLLFLQMDFLRCLIGMGVNQIDFDYELSLSVFNWATGLFAALLVTLSLKWRSESAETA